MGEASLSQVTWCVPHPGLASQRCGQWDKQGGEGQEEAQGVCPWDQLSQGGQLPMALEMSQV